MRENFEQPARKAPSKSESVAPDGDKAELAPADPWNQRGVYIRLSKLRKAALRRFAEQSGHMDTPHQALAACIEQAVAFHSRQPSAQSDDCHAQPAEFDAMELVNDRLDAMQEALAGIQRAIYAVETSLAHKTPLSLETETAITLSDEKISTDGLTEWLNSRDISADEPEKIILLRSRCIGFEFGPPADGIATLRLQVETVDVEDEAGRRFHCMQSLRLPLNSPLANAVIADPGNGFIMACQAMPLGGCWAVSYFRDSKDTQIGDLVDTIAIP